MGKRMKIWLIIAAALILIGCILFAGVMTVMKWDFTKLSTVKYVTSAAPQTSYLFPLWTIPHR